jgi:hypothetical protein
VEARTKFAGKDVVFLGFTGEGKANLARSEKFLKDHKVEWPNAYGAEPVLKALAVEAFPTTFVFGRDGKVAWHDELDGSLADAIAKALEAAPGP